MQRIHRMLLCLAVAALLTPTFASAQLWTSARPDGHAPIGVMADHTHEGGEIMLSYRFMRMTMKGLRDGTEELSTDDVLEDYMVTPVEMPMSMHMAGMMLAPSDRITLMLMVPLLQIDMDHETRAGGMFTTSASGIGDIKASAMVVLFNNNRKKMHLNLGVSAPTGSIEAMDETPASGGNEVQLPYPMQLGSGSFELRPGFTFLGQSDSWSWGVQASSTFRLGENDHEYKLGQELGGTAWWALMLNNWVSASLRVQATNWGNIDGADPALNPMMVPTADPDLRGGTRVDGLAGINFEWRGGSLNGQRLAVEFGMPVYQSLDGPQLATDWTIVVGWQYAFVAFR